jgi:general secretion pathway protein E
VFYANPLWLLLFIASALIWLYASGWVSNDAVGVGMNYQLWAGLLLATGSVGLVFALLFHAAASLLTVLAVVVTFSIYITNRNAVVPEMHKFLGKHHRARILRGMPLLGRVPQAQGPLAAGGPVIPLVNADGQALGDLVAAEPELAQAGSILFETLVRACSTESQEVRFIPENDQYVSRFVMDGVLHNVESFPAEVGQKLLAAASVFLGLTRDGRMRQGSGTATADLPGVGDLKVGMQIGATRGRPNLVLRLPRWHTTLHMQGLEALGMHEAVTKRVNAVLEQDNGGLIVCGPAGCGKTTTLHAIVSAVDFFTTDVFVIEKEEELPLEHVRRFAIPPQGSFGEFYEGVLREGPQNLAFADLETPEQVQRALGFGTEEGLLLAAVTSNSAPDALLRLVRMAGGADPVSRAVTCVLSQQLVRKLCTACREQVEPNPALIEKLDLNPEDPGKWYRPVGCAACLGSGYHGRTGIFAMLILTDPVKEVLAGGRSISAADISNAAGTMAFRTLYQDGISKVTGGITTLDELRRVLKKQ